MPNAVWMLGVLSDEEDTWTGDFLTATEDGYLCFLSEVDAEDAMEKQEIRWGVRTVPVRVR